MEQREILLKVPYYPGPWPAFHDEEEDDEGYRRVLMAGPELLESDDSHRFESIIKDGIIDSMVREVLGIIDGGKEYEPDEYSLRDVEDFIVTYDLSPPSAFGCEKEMSLKELERSRVHLLVMRVRNKRKRDHEESIKKQRMIGTGMSE